MQKRNVLFALFTLLLAVAAVGCRNFGQPIDIRYELQEEFALADIDVDAQDGPDGASVIVTVHDDDAELTEEQAEEMVEIVRESYTDGPVAFVTISVNGEEFYRDPEEIPAS